MQDEVDLKEQLSSKDQQLIQAIENRSRMDFILKKIHLDLQVRYSSG